MTPFPKGPIGSNKKSLNNEDVLIMYFYTDWCPYCKKAEPEWEKFKQYVKNINNTKIIFITNYHNFFSMIEH